jgi:hypothetical protein
MFKKTILALVMSAGLLTLTAPLQAAPAYTLRQFNVDDVLSAYITNANFTNQLLLTTLFGQDTTIDFTAFTAPGTNTLNFVLTSDHGGWAYGFEVKQDATVIDSGSCGTITVIGCNNNDGATGTVYTHATTFDIGDGTGGGAAPEPASILMTGTGFLGVWTYLKRRSRKNLAA